MAHVAIVFCLLLAVVAAAPKKKKVSKSDGRIVGGSWTDISDAPYQVSLQWNGGHFCGGSILGPRHVLTAAHCVERGYASDFSVRAGSSSHEKGGQVRRVKKITKHPYYDTRTLDSDLAVVELAASLAINSDVMPIGLAESEPVEGEGVLVSGWGGLREGKSSTIILQSVPVPVVSRITCQEMYQKFGRITPNMFCAGYKKGGRDACQGDSGGPAIVNGKQAGIVSWGIGCARENHPGVYTNVAKYRKWIQSLIY